MNTSYVRGNAIHHSNNRACTLHDISNATVEHNVAYNIKGLTFFLEDGVEMYNIIQYNLAVFTRMSNSLLNPDINPASFWIVNPNNKFRHNSCAGELLLSKLWVKPFFQEELIFASGCAQQEFLTAHLTHKSSVLSRFH